MFIKKESESKALSNNILSLAQAAKKAKDENNEVINATIGMLYDSNNEFYTFGAVKDIMNEISDYDAFSYSDTDGGELYQSAVLKWLLGEYLTTFTDKYHVGVCATNGGSGAIATTFQNYMERGDSVIVPKVMWETYITLARERGCSHLTYELTDKDQNFNIKSLKESILSLKDKQERIIIVINDPCHNPTGFCMSDNDYDNLIELLNSFNDTKFVLLMDVAYFDYFNKDTSIIRKRFAKLTNLNENTIINFAFSGSKTFGLYGLRIGAGVMFSQDKSEINAYKNATAYTARNNWGSSSTLGNSIITKLVLDEKHNANFTSELQSAAEMVAARSDAFITEANKIGLPMLDFKRGFFVVVPTSNPVGLMNKLHEYNAYVVVTKTCIRIALCAINEAECKRLPHLIKQAMQDLGEL